MVMSVGLMSVAVRCESARRLANLRMARSVPRRDFADLAVVGALRHQNGIASGAVLQYDALRRSGARVRLLDSTSVLRNPLARVVHSPASAYVMHIGVPETSMLVHGVLPGAQHAWRIGYWAWELPDMPPHWGRFESLVSEIWTPSKFCADSMSKVFTCPIQVVPHRVQVKTMRHRDPSQPLTVLVMADSRSSFARKNPLAAVEAFDRAFGGSPDAKLVVKLNGRPVEMSAFARMLPQRSNVEVIASYLDNAGMAELYRSADVLISLHRAEGFGLPLLEAMSYGLPVVGTSWSGNMDFMNESNSLPVPYRLVPVKDSAKLYYNSFWADPDIDVAADMLRLLAKDDVLYTKLSAAAHRSVEEATPLNELLGIPARPSEAD